MVGFPDKFRIVTGIYPHPHEEAVMNAEIDPLEKQIYDLKAQLSAARRKVTPEPVKDWPGVSALRKTEGGAIERTWRRLLRAVAAV